MSLWELEIADWGHRLGIERLSGTKPGSKIVYIRRRKGELDERGGTLTMSHPRPSLTVYLAHTLGRSGRPLGSIWNAANKVLDPLTCLSSLIALDLLHLLAGGERMSAVLQQA